MHVEQLTSEQIDSLVGTRDGLTDIAYPPQGLQPYHQWLIQTLHRLAACSLGAWRVDRAPDEPMMIAIAPGRASIDEVVVAYDGGTLDLASFNNATAHVWLAEDEGEAVVDAGSDWPESTHLKLAEVMLSEGRIADLIDRRLEALFRV